jgi:hypothetical protein
MELDAKEYLEINNAMPWCHLVACRKVSPDRKTADQVQLESISATIKGLETNLAFWMSKVVKIDTP